MKRIWHDSDIDAGITLGKTIGIVGYGIQGRAQAQNLRDTGHSVIVGGRAGGSGIAAARKDDFPAFPTPEAVERADVVFLLTPDDTHKSVLETDVNPYLKRGATLGFACGFSLRFGSLALPEGANVVMVAPKGPGRTLRDRFLVGSGLPALVGVQRDASGNALGMALAYAAGIGSGRVAVIESSFEEEAVTDLFGEQAVLCGGIPRLMTEGFELLVSKGYSAEAAYIECIWEAKAIVDLIFEQGIDGMYQQISPTARYGGQTRGGRVIGSSVVRKMEAVLKEIQKGHFADELACASSKPLQPSETVPENLRETWARLKAAFGGKPR